MSSKYSALPVPSSDALPKNIKIRWASIEDVSALAAAYYNSFYTSHVFWKVFLPDTPACRKWWTDAWKMGLEDPTVRTFVAIDTDPDAINKIGIGPNGEKFDPAGFKGKDGDVIVGFCRWIVPQADGNLERAWPELVDDFDMDIAGPFFGGMETNRHELMDTRPHWFLELLGTTAPYQGCGIGLAFLQWGCQLADAEDMEVYIDASQKGAPFYQKFEGCQPKRSILLPERRGEGGYGTYTYVSHVRPRKSEKK